MNHPTPPRRSVFRALATAFALVALAPLAFSQATPSPPPAEPEDVVTLREFQVSAARATSAYLATESTAGTRTSAMGGTRFFRRPCDHSNNSACDA